MKWLKRLGIGLTIAFFAVCCGAVLLFNWGSLGWKALSVPTGSMRPHIPPGSLVLTHSVPLSSLKVGDVITYINPQTMKSTVTHRIVKEFKIDGKVPAFITKGDANKSADPWTVVGGLVQGKAVWHAPDIGAWLQWSKSWLGLAILVYIPATILMIEEVQRLNQAFKQAKPYRQARLVLSQRLAPKKSHRLAQATTISIALVASSVLLAFPAEALLRSNTVTLGPNNLTVASITPPQCATNTTTITTNGGGHTTVVVNNSSSQSASSGNITSSGNTNGGSATSGNVSNTNCTNININIH